MVSVLGSNLLDCVFWLGVTTINLQNYSKVCVDAYHFVDFVLFFFSLFLSYWTVTVAWFILSCGFVDGLVFSSSISCRTPFSFFLNGMFLFLMNSCNLVVSCLLELQNICPGLLVFTVSTEWCALFLTDMLRVPLLSPLYSVCLVL